MSTVTITRHQLYDQVWSKPMLHLAREYGLSDVGMAKLCSRLDIPHPSRGYWAKLHFGHRVRRTPLPNPKDDCEVTMNLPDASGEVEAELRDVLQREITRERQQEARLVVAETLRGCHELVSRTNQELQGAEKDHNSLLIRPEKLPLDIQVSQGQLRRALLIMDALLKALEQRGYRVEAGPTVSMLDETISFGLQELLNTVREQPSEHDLEGSYSFGHSRFSTRREPSGRLLLRIHDAGMHGAGSCRKSWRDAKKQRIEDCLNKFIAALIEFAAHKKEDRIAAQRRALAAAEAERLRQEEARIRARKRELQKQERANVDALLQRAICWKQSQDLREFIEVVKQQHVESDGAISPECQMGRWIAWATQQADRLDPLRESPPSILDEEIPEEPKRWSW